MVTSVTSIVTDVIDIITIMIFVTVKLFAYVCVRKSIDTIVVNDVGVE
ncbi:hypothetical protein [Brevibacillus sp. SKDU10]|nr:hypothetical protein [Brevibacillus sp. SKDU10]